MLLPGPTPADTEMAVLGHNDGAETNQIFMPISDDSDSDGGEQGNGRGDSLEHLHPSAVHAADTASAQTDNCFQALSSDSDDDADTGESTPLPAAEAATKTLTAE